jgi:hypothetical protein
MYEGISKSFRIGRLARELQMAQLSATRCSCIAIFWVSLVSFAAITLCVASQRLLLLLLLLLLLISLSTQSGNFWIHPPIWGGVTILYTNYVREVSFQRPFAYWHYWRSKCNNYRWFTWIRTSVSNLREEHRFKGLRFEVFTEVKIEVMWSSCLLRRVVWRLDTIFRVKVT